MKAMGKDESTEVLQGKLDSAQLEENKLFVGEKSYDPEFERSVLYSDMRPGEDTNAMMERLAKATTKDHYRPHGPQTNHEREGPHGASSLDVPDTPQGNPT